MIRKSVKPKKETVNGSVNDVSTPLLDKYYREMRKRIRFPRYYRKSLNW